MEDQTSEWLAFIGGQLITGKEQFPEHVGPSPLLRPATAIITVGISLPGPHNYTINIHCANHYHRIDLNKNTDS